VFVIDNSGSINDSDPSQTNRYWRMMINFVKSIVEVFSVGVDATRFALIDFGMLLIYDYGVIMIIGIFTQLSEAVNC